MMRRNALIAVVLLLVVLNVMRWIGGDGAVVEVLPGQMEPMLVDAAGLGVKSSGQESFVDAGRDIFAYVTRSEPKQEQAREQDEKANRLAKEREAQLRSERQGSPQGKLRYAGMAKRNGVVMAYVLLNETPSIVKEGDMVDGRYRVVSVTASELKVMDVSTKSVYQISIGNKFN